MTGSLSLSFSLSFLFFFFVSLVGFSRDSSSDRLIPATQLKISTGWKTRGFYHPRESINLTHHVLLPSWIVKGPKRWLMIGPIPWLLASLRKEVFPALKEMVMCLLKRPSLEPMGFCQLPSVSNHSFLGKVVEKVVRTLGETDYEGQFQLGFRPGFNTETALINCVRMAMVHPSECFLICQWLSVKWTMVSLWVGTKRCGSFSGASYSWC